VNIITFRVPWLTAGANRGEPFPRSEWLLTNGLGGYSAGVITGHVSRRYHGLLVAALGRPPGRFLMLNHLEESIRLSDEDALFFGQGEQRPEDAHVGAAGGMTEFRLENGLPIWHYEFAEFTVEKRLLMPYRQNTILISYRLAHGKGVLPVRVRPMFHYRAAGAPITDSSDPGPYFLNRRGAGFEIRGGSADLPPTRFLVHGGDAQMTAEAVERQVYYALEDNRYEPAIGTFWGPAEVAFVLAEDAPVTLTASTEDWPTIEAVRPNEAFAAELDRREGLLAAAAREARSSPVAGLLVLAADQFIIEPARHAVEPGACSRSVIAGYHWFTDWGRDTMISLEGLTLVTGRRDDARGILRTFAAAIRDGLIPNLFPEDQREAVYHTADASLWFFHALGRYLEITADSSLLQELLPQMLGILEHHFHGTRFGIGVDPSDGLLRQGDPHYPLTWMDAQVGDWVVTPRRGKAVEINALWYNALRLLEGWLHETGDDNKAREMAHHAEQAWRSFNTRFWRAEAGCLFDVVDGESGDDPSCRPNQILAFSLTHPVLDPRHWQAVLEVVGERLLTPVGLRSLAPDMPGYHPYYFGNRRSRDAAYHHGAVWPWLLGPYLDAFLRVHPHRGGEVHALLSGVLGNLGMGCLGSINEIFDAEPPYTPRGCVAQAWSVAEVLRHLIKTVRR
jgi:glycogen debranching enzyme